jgi:AraC-like DNA-binding protein
MEHRVSHDGPVSVYRELAPRSELRDVVRALAWFGPACGTTRDRPVLRELFVAPGDSLAPSFADAHASLVFDLPIIYKAGDWRPSSSLSSAIVMGAVTRATYAPTAERAAMIGVYLRPRGIARLLGVPGSELTDRVISLNEIWRGFEHDGERATLESVEAVLLRRLRDGFPRSVDVVADLATYVRRRAGRASVGAMSELSGFSRQHLTRLFREQIGIGPKLYARLARFRAALAHVGGSERAMSWSSISARLGYADQSHLIADFREFTSFTPEQMARGECFHPFIGDRTAQLVDHEHEPDARVG